MSEIVEDLRKKIQDSDYDKIINLLSGKTGRDYTREEIDEALNSPKLSSDKSVRWMQQVIKFYLAFKEFEQGFFEEISLNNLGSGQFTFAVKAAQRYADVHINELDRSSWYPDRTVFIE